MSCLFLSISLGQHAVAAELKELSRSSCSATAESESERPRRGVEFRFTRPFAPAYMYLSHGHISILGPRDCL
eukprot:355993-Chlamydomonas_euryale.AAC.23